LGWVYNGIDVASFPYDDDKSDYLLFLSRISPEKGPLQAIEVAKRTGRQLVMAGKIDAVDKAFFEECVAGEIDDDQVVFVGEADAVMKRHLYRKAACLLMPLQWEEPFGLVMAEAQACGTSVVALNRGSAPEVVADGATGFVVDGLEEMTCAIGRLSEIDPRACREHVEANFSAEAMTSRYVDLYRRLAGGATREESPDSLELAAPGA
jgi:glycosyltransferase involved in cell wall biosynthesis